MRLNRFFVALAGALALANCAPVEQVESYAVVCDPATDSDCPENTTVIVVD